MDQSRNTEPTNPEAPSTEAGLTANPGPDENGDAASTSDSPSGARISWPHLYLGALGFAVALYALRVHNIVARGGESGCSDFSPTNCDAVLASDFAKWFNIPLGAYGMAYFIVVIMMGITTNPKTTNLQAALWRLLLLSAGVCNSIYLTYVSIFRIKESCAICLTNHAIVLVLFTISLVQYLKERRKAAQDIS